VQEYSKGSHGSRANPRGITCPSNTGGKNWPPGAYNPQLGLMFITSVEGCNAIDTVEQKSFVDQGGTVRPRDRFDGGGVKSTEKRHGSLKAIDPTTGETKAVTKFPYLPYSGVLATAGNIVFTGHLDGTFAAYDAKTLQELWSHNVGAGINAPPITYSVNGKQYVAVLVGARERVNLYPETPELKNVALAHMLVVFGL
jgi:alcohol dehydrogenase (cytochrome c)